MNTPVKPPANAPLYKPKKVLMRVEGMDGQVEVMADRVVIHRAGIWNAFKFGLNAKREIPLGMIAEVGFRPARIQFGEIEFIRGGMNTDEKKVKTGAVKFGRKHNEQFEALKEKVFELINEFNKNRNH